MRIPEAVRDAWKRRDGPVILATMDGDSTPNTIYVKSVNLYGDDRVVVADNYFDKTRRNIKAGSRGAVLFITGDGNAYQLKGPLEYHDSGPLFDEMKKWNPPKHPGHAAVALVVEEVYSGSTRLTE